MGKMVMKKFFSRDNFLFSSFNDKQRKQSLFVALLMIVIFLFSSFTFFNALYGFADVVGSIVSGSADVAIKDALRSIPLFLSAFMSIWTLLLLHANFRNVEERRLRSTFKDGICLIAFSGISIIYTLVGRITGTYLSLVEGSPSAIYPLDSIIFSAIFLVVGIFAILYSKKFKDVFPYEVPTRAPIVKRARFIYCFGVSIWMLVALFGLSAGVYSMFIYDFAHEYSFYGVAVILIYLLSPIMLCVWQFYYNELKEEKRREFLLPLSILGLGCSLVLIILYMVALSTNMDAPSNAGFGMFPVAFAASVNIATLVVVFTPLIVSIVAFIKGMIARKQK